MRGEAASTEHAVPACKARHIDRDQKPELLLGGGGVAVIVVTHASAVTLLGTYQLGLPSLSRSEYSQFDHFDLCPFKKVTVVDCYRMQSYSGH